MKLVRGKVLLLPVMAAALVACGGGGDDGDVQPVETVTLQGTVAKGLVSGAKLRVLSAAATPEVLASGVTTDKDGRYSIKLNKPSGPVVIEADLEGADIADELQPGVTYKGRAGEKMRAIIAAASAATTANVTPFSEMAVDLVAEAGWNPAAVTDANKLVRQLLNNTDHLTASPTAGALLTSLTAVQQLVNNTDGGLAAVLQQLRDAAQAGDGAVSISPELTKTLDAACGDSAACADAFATPPAPVVIGTGDSIDAVYALFQDLRDTLLAYSNEDQTGELDVATSRLGDAVEAAVQPIDEEMLGLMAMFSKGDQLYRAFKAGDSTQLTVQSGSSYGRVVTVAPDGTSVGNGFLPRYGCEVARATIVTKADGALDVGSDYTTAEVTSSNANVFACYGVGTVGRLYPSADGVNSYWQSVIFIPQADGSFKYVHQLRTRPFDQRAGSATRVKAFYGSLGVTRDSTQDLTGFNLNGKLVPGLMGHEPGEYATLDRVDAQLAFMGSAPTSTSAKYDLSGSMTLYKKDNVFASSVEIASGSMVAVKTDVPYSYTDYIEGGASCPAGSTPAPWSTAPYLWCETTVTDIEEGFSALNLDVTVTAPGVKFQGLVSADTPSFDSTGTVYTPTKMSLQGKIYEADGAGYRLLLDGKGSVQLLNFANFDATSGLYAPINVGFDGKVLLKNRPEMGLTLSGAQTTTGEQSLSGTFFWNSKALKLAAAADGAWTVSNDAGVRFTIPAGGSDTAQDVFLGNVKVGTINFGLSRIEYADGRFQQF